MDYRERLEILREKQGLRKNKFSALMGSSAPYYLRILSGEKPLSLKHATRLNEALGINIDWLMNGNGDIFASNHKTLEKENDKSQEVRTIPERLEYLRNKKGLNINDFCEILNIDTSYYAKVLSGEKHLVIRHLTLLSNSLNANVFWLMNGKGKPFVYNEKLNQIREGVMGTENALRQGIMGIENVFRQMASPFIETIREFNLKKKQFVEKISKFNNDETTREEKEEIIDWFMVFSKTGGTAALALFCPEIKDINPALYEFLRERGAYDHLTGLEYFEIIDTKVSQLERSEFEKLLKGEFLEQGIWKPPEKEEI